MYKAYAHFTVKHPYIHGLNLIALLVIFIVSGYQLLENENLIYAAGFLLISIPAVIFAKASDYKRKYINAKC
ncbi:hypothetical protein ACQKP8_08985 [Photobacterium alginatilyticum]|uniref:hypothetical protein n=1 Tax=Photobacterium alginatilyticum TaxID=1775171 RepID=UPI004068B1E6